MGRIIPCMKWKITNVWNHQYIPTSLAFFCCEIAERFLGGSFIPDLVRWFSQQRSKPPLFEQIVPIWLVVWNIFPYTGNVIIPTDFHIFQRGRYTTNQLCSFTLEEYSTIAQMLIYLEGISWRSYPPEVCLLVCWFIYPSKWLYQY